MIKNSKSGGATTTANGNAFEQKMDLEKFLIDNEFQVNEVKKRKYKEVIKDGETVGYLTKKNSLYKFLEDKGIDWTTKISKKLLPDEAFYTIINNVFHVIEYKFQNRQGSVDEKIQTCGFKKRQYNRLLSDLGYNVKYSYVLSSWFERPEYADVKEYIRETGCDYFIEELPTEIINFVKD